VPPRSKSIYGLTLIKKDACLAFPYRKLSSVFDFPGTFLGKSVNKFLTGIVEPFQIFLKNDIVCAHNFGISLKKDERRTSNKKDERRTSNVQR
jgi:hypothetical protein